MFVTFRQRLLFWFLVFIGTSLLSMVFSGAYLRQKDDILATSDIIEQSYIVLLKNVLAQQDFFSYEVKNNAFFETGASKYLDRYDSLFEQTGAKLEAAYQAATKSNFQLSNRLEGLEQEFFAIDSLFHTLIEKVKQRGFKDYSLEGAMRKDAHWLEEVVEIPTSEVLSLRRHEKDYIIRNDTRYVEKLNALASSLAEQIEQQSNISGSRKDSILNRLNNYQEKFNEIVKLDKELGIKNNSGLKADLDDRIHALENRFNQLVEAAQEQKQRLFNRLNWIFGGLAVLLLFTSILLSSIISRKITKPLTELTSYITQFVDSNFTLETDNPSIRSKDEVGKLTRNFTILKDEIIAQLKYFKQKVDERTAELANANLLLKRLNMANSRFVPKAFLDFLGKVSIEEISLGDQVEKEMTIMFTDIRSFTKISETLNPQENFDFINAYLKAVVPVIQNNGGVIDKYIGDSVMALFPAESFDAINAAITFNEALNELDLETIKPGLPPIQVGVGMHTGRLILGTIGHNDRLETTVISDTVNIASRVEGLTKFYGAEIIVTEESIQQLPPDHSFHYRFLDRVNVKGKSKSISIYEILLPSQTKKLGYQEKYQKAIEYFNNRAIEQAHLLFSEIIQENPSDGAVQKLMTRLNQYLESGLPENWDGIQKMDQK